MWTLTAVFWTISNSDSQWFYWFFENWARALHYVDVIRLIIVGITKTIGIATDRKTDYGITDGYDMDVGDTTLVSMSQRLTATDWYNEAFGLTVSFSLYGDLLGISQWARDELEKEKSDAAEEKLKNKEVPKKKREGLPFQPSEVDSLK